MARKLTCLVLIFDKKRAVKWTQINSRKYETDSRERKRALKDINITRKVAKLVIY